MPQTLTVSFDCIGLESIIAELKARPGAAHAVMQLLRDGRYRELFTLASENQDGVVVLKFVPTDLMRFMLAAAEC
jgi:hypothetical protein